MRFYFIQIFVSTLVILASCFVLFILYDKVIKDEWIPKISVSNKKKTSLTDRITTEETNIFITKTSNKI